MNLIWHIVAKDFRRLKWPLLLWLSFSVLSMILVLGGAAQFCQGMAEFDAASTHGFVWRTLVFLSGFILASWLVMEDGLVGTKAFWRTRPISSGRLLGAKMAGAFLMFAVLPASTLVPVWLWVGFSAEEITRAAAELMSSQGMMCVAAFVLASVTASARAFFVRFIGAVLVVPGSLAFALGVFERAHGGVTGGVAETRYWLILPLLVLTPLIMIVHQYLTRSQTRSWAILGVGLAVAFAVRLGWRWDLSDRLAHSSETETGGLGAFKTSLVRLEASPGAEVKKTGSLRMVVQMTRPRPGIFARLEVAQAWWPEAAGYRKGAHYELTGGGPTDECIRQALGWSAPPEVPMVTEGYGNEPIERLAEYKKKSLEARIEISGTLMRGELLGRLPLQQGAILRASGSQTRVVAVERKPGELVVWLEELEAWPLWSVSFLLGGGVVLPPDKSAPPEALLIINTTNEQEKVWMNVTNQSVRFNSISIRACRLDFKVPTREVNGRREAIPGWEDNLVLVKTRFTPIEPLTRWVSADLSALPEI